MLYKFNLLLKQPMKNISSIKYPPLSTIIPANIEITANPRFCTDWHLKMNKKFKFNIPDTPKLEYEIYLTFHKRFQVDIPGWWVLPKATNLKQALNKTTPLKSAWMRNKKSIRFCPKRKKWDNSMFRYTVEKWRVLTLREIESWAARNCETKWRRRQPSQRRRQA